MVNRYTTFVRNHYFIIIHQFFRGLRDDPSRSDMHNRQGLTPRMLWNALSDWRMWPLYIHGLLHMSELYHLLVRNKLITAQYP